jgi:membrane-associated phospholipid phosphatase
MILPIFFSFSIILGMNSAAFGQEKTTSKEQKELTEEELKELSAAVVGELKNNVDEALTHNETLNSLRESDLVFKDDKTDWDIIKSIPKDAWETVKAPIGWDKKEWFIAGSVVGVTSLIMTQDLKIKNFVQENKTELSESISYVAEMGGSQAQWGLGATYLVGAILKDQKLKRAAVVAMSALIISGTLNQGLKMLFGRERPYDSPNSQWNFHGPPLSHKSFPSGHTTAAFAVASSIATSYDSTLVKILAYTAATLTGISRIHDNAHWASDVFMGAATGTAMGIFITKRHMMANPNKVQMMPAQIVLDNGESAFGVGVRIPFANGKNRKKKIVEND